VRGLFDAWETTLSRFRPESELSRLNERPGRPVRASTLLLTVLDRALASARDTDGLYDPTLGRRLEDLGYDRSFELIPSVAAGSPPAREPGGAWRAVALDRASGTVVVPPGVRLDLGGIAKGMAVDAAAAALRRAGVTDALVSAGGDLAVVGRPPGRPGWPVAVDGHDGPPVWVARGALATSSVGRRRWRQGDLERHHLLDPRTGEPAAGGLRSVTVAASRCARAEVAAKAALILGPRGGRAFLAERGLSGLLLPASGPPLVVGTWPGERAAPA
jgi:FAD:protein FMN transferase